MKTAYNPYVVQMDKFATSLHHLSDTFLKLEEKKGILTEAETENIFLEIDEKAVSYTHLWRNRQGCWEHPHLPRFSEFPFRCLCRFFYRR